MPFKKLNATKEEEKGGGETVKTSIKVNPGLWKEAKIASIQHNMELSEIVEKGLRSELDKLRRSTEVRS